MARETVAVETLARLAISRMSIAGVSPGLSKRLPALYSTGVVCGLQKLTPPHAPENRRSAPPTLPLAEKQRRRANLRLKPRLDLGERYHLPDQNRETAAQNYPKLE